MKSNWPVVRKALVMGLLLTGGGIALLVYTGWNEATILCLGLGPFLLVCSLALTLFYVRMAHVDPSRFPERWETLSSEAKREEAEKRAMEYRKGLTLRLLRMTDAQRNRGVREKKQP
ncbi:MAG TPA: hypothetical protein VF026_09790 [Ktedonobacteraceae bacterium]